MLAAMIVFQLPMYAQANYFINNNTPASYNNEDSIESKNTNTKDSADITVKKESPAQKRAFARQQKTFKVYPNPANNIVYLRIYGEQMITLRNSSDSLIFKVRIRQKATVNIRKLPNGTYYFTDLKTGLKQEMVIAH